MVDTKAVIELLENHRRFRSFVADRSDMIFSSRSHTNCPIGKYLSYHIPDVFFSIGTTTWSASPCSGKVINTSQTITGDLEPWYTEIIESLGEETIKGGAVVRIMDRL